jgi:predicted ATPase
MHPVYQGEEYAVVFGRVLAETHTSVRRLAFLSGVSRRTLENWTDGTVRRPRYWEPVLQVARVLHLPAAETDALLLAAGQPSLATLQKAHAGGAHAGLLAVWQSPADHAGTDPPQLALRAGLPLPATPFIGRETHLRELVTLVTRTDVRLITVTGPGGMGKTRLAIEVARQAATVFPDGVYFVSLDSVITAEGLVDRLMTDLAITRDPAISPLEAVVGFLYDRRTLLILDTFENVLSSAGLISQLIQGAPELTILVTSRIVLRLSSEHVFALSALAGGPEAASVATIANYEAVTLFAARARASRPDFALTDANAADVLAICRLVEGLPLALELAAAQTRVLPVQQLRQQLEKDLGLLVGGPRDAPARQQSIEETIAWSHDLLGSDEQVLLRRLSVYRDGCTLAAAQAIAGPDILDGSGFITALTGLLDHSLLQYRRLGGQRVYHMHALTRQYAFAQLAQSGEHDGTMSRLLHFLEDLAERANRHIRDSERAYWLGQFDPEAEHIWLVLEWGLGTGQSDIVARCLRLCGLMRQYWNLRGQVDLGRKWTERALEAARALALPDAVQTSALLNASALALIQADGRTCAERATVALQVAREAGDDKSEADALHLLGLAAYYRGDLAEAETMWNTALPVAERFGGSALALALDDLGNLASRLGHFEQALSLHQREQNVSRSIGDLYSEFYAVLNLGDVSIRLGQLDEAESHNRRALEISHELGDVRGQAHTLITQARLMRRRERLPEARELLRQALRLAWRIQNIDIVLTALEQLLLAEQVASTTSQIRVLSLIDQQRVRYGPSSYPEDESAIQALATLLRQQVGTTLYQDEWTAGRTLSWETAISLALRANTGTAGPGSDTLSVQRDHPERVRR